jgi:polyisoprenoid-binding protein YceI
MAIELWQADPTHSQITFKLRHLILATIEGRAQIRSAEIRIDPDQPARSSIHAVIDAQSIDTGVPERDDHIRSAEFLDATVHREIRFKSTTIVPATGGRYLVTGILTVRDVAREVSLEVEDLGRSTTAEEPPHINFRAHASFDRQHFRLHWNQDLDRGGVVLGDKVEVTIALEASRTSSAVAAADARR